MNRTQESWLPVSWNTHVTHHSLPNPGNTPSPLLVWVQSGRSATGAQKNIWDFPSPCSSQIVSCPLCYMRCWDDGILLLLLRSLQAVSGIWRQVCLCSLHLCIQHWKPRGPGEAVQRPNVCRYSDHCAKEGHADSVGPLKHSTKAEF